MCGVAAKRQTSDLNVTGMLPRSPQDMYAMICAVGQ